jgi:hypothetical protein
MNRTRQVGGVGVAVQCHPVPRPAVAMAASTPPYAATLLQVGALNMLQLDASTCSAPVDVFNVIHAPGWRWRSRLVSYGAHHGRGCGCSPLSVRCHVAGGRSAHNALMACTLVRCALQRSGPRVRVAMHMLE